MILFVVVVVVAHGTRSFLHEKFHRPTFVNITDGNARTKYSGRNRLHRLAHGINLKFGMRMKVSKSSLVTIPIELSASAFREGTDVGSNHNRSTVVYERRVSDLCRCERRGRREVDVW